MMNPVSVKGQNCSRETLKLWANCAEIEEDIILQIGNDDKVRKPIIATNCSYT